MSIADDLVDALRPWMTDDLETYLREIGGMFSEVELYAIADDDDQGWTILFDPDRAPVKALPYLAQYVGERLPEGLEEAMQREWIKDAPNQRRGTVMSIVRTAQRHLTGLRTVQIHERAGATGGDDPDRLIVVTYVNETPDSAAVLRDLRHNTIPHDVELIYSVFDGQSWADVLSTHASWADVAADYATWQDVRNEQPGYTTYTRPRP